MQPTGSNLRTRTTQRANGPRRACLDEYRGAEKGAIRGSVERLGLHLWSDALEGFDHASLASELAPIWGGCCLADWHSLRRLHPTSRRFSRPGILRAAVDADSELALAGRYAGLVFHFAVAVALCPAVIAQGVAAGLLVFAGGWAWVFVLVGGEGLGGVVGWERASGDVDTELA